MKTPGLIRPRTKQKFSQKNNANYRLCRLSDFYTMHNGCVARGDNQDYAVMLKGVVLRRPHKQIMYAR